MPIECVVCGSHDIECRRYGFDPMFCQIACFDCARIHMVRADIEEIVLED